MVLTTTKEDLNKGLAWCSRLISARPNLPILNNFLLRASKTGLTIAATNLETSIKVEISAKTDQEGETTVPARVLSEFVNSVKEEKLKLSLEKENLVVIGEKTKVSLATISPLEFPPLPETKSLPTLEIKAEDFIASVNQVVFAASADEARPALTGLLLKKTKEGILFVATDGYRLAKKQTKLELDESDLLIPARPLQEIARLASESSSAELKVAVLAEKNQVVFLGDRFEIATRVLDGTFPDFEQIIPNKFVASLDLNRENLVEAVKLTAILARDLGNVIQIKTKAPETITVSAKTAQIGEAETKVAGKVGGEALEIAFNSKYLLDGLSAFTSETIKIEFSGSTSPTLIKNPKENDFEYVVMPVRIQN